MRKRTRTSRIVILALRKALPGMERQSSRPRLGTATEEHAAEDEQTARRSETNGEAEIPHRGHSRGERFGRGREVAHRPAQFGSAAGRETQSRREFETVP